MKIKKLEKKLNNLNPKIEFAVSKSDLDIAYRFNFVHKGDIEVYMKNKHGELSNKPILLFIIKPPHENIDFWSIDLRGEVTFWSTRGLKTYIQALKTVKKFLDSKN